MQRSLKYLILSALAVLSLAPAANAGGNDRHLLDMYKVEKFVSLNEGDGVDNLSMKCNNGDFAVDGMWRVDSVDYNPVIDEPGPYGDWNRYNAIEVYQSESVAPDEWQFSMVEGSSGQAQIHLWITCLGKKTAPDTVRHKLVMSDLYKSTETIPAHSVWLLNAGNKTCDDGEIAVAHGFTYDGDGVLKIFKSWPADSTMRRWVFGFYAPGDPDITTSVRCLSIETDSLGSGHKAHRHSLKPAFRQATATIKKNTVAQVQLSCGDTEKGLMGAFDVRGNNTGWGADYDSHKLWYIGQEPQIKSRVFHIWNHDSTTDYKASFGAVCFDDRTSGIQR